MIIQKLYTHFKKTPGTHKLGVIYVVDSVTRQWLDHARKAKQTVSQDAAGGTFAAGVFHVTELLPSFMNDTLNNAPDDQKVRILEKLLCNDPLATTILDRVFATIMTITILLCVQKNLMISSKSQTFVNSNLRISSPLRLES